MKKILVIGNWKANPKTNKEAKKLLKAIESGVKKISISYGYAVPDIYFPVLREEKIRGLLGVQNVGAVEEGAHTGKNSLSMCLSMGADFTLIGHSEVRQGGESETEINEKVKACLINKLTTVLCVGETTRDKEGQYISVIEKQLQQALLGVSGELCHKLVIAYEPVWAIGAGTSATAEQCFEAIIAIRRTLATLLGIEYAKKVLVLYGGTVTRQNAVDFIVDGSADGLLVGRTSLNDKDFSGLLHNVYEASN
jgi:triosephosphate isomerase